METVQTCTDREFGGLSLIHLTGCSEKGLIDLVLFG